jgi:hypothetical protein
MPISMVRNDGIGIQVWPISPWDKKKWNTTMDEKENAI